MKNELYKKLSNITKFLDDYVIIIYIFFFVIISLCIYIILNSEYMKKVPIVLVFDLDETLGSFSQLSNAKYLIEKIENRKLKKEEFYELLDNNKECLRPGIIDILKYVVNKRNNGYCDSIMIYTNNQGYREWVYLISDYFSFKVGEKVFDQIIAAFKVNGVRLEPGRTSHDKSYDDFIRCTKLPSSTQVCFCDDVEHKKMEHKNVFYINIKPYTYRLPIPIFLQRYYKGKKMENNLEYIYQKYNNIYGANIWYGGYKSTDEQELDKVISKYLLKRIDEFFKNQKKHKKRKTIKKIKNIDNK